MPIKHEFKVGDHVEWNSEAGRVHAIRHGGGFGSIVGRNSFQRDKAAALSLLDPMVRIYQGEAESP